MGKWNHSRNFLANLPLSWKFSLMVLIPLLLMGLITTVTIEKSLGRLFHQELIEDAYAIGNSLAASTAYHLLENDPKGIRNLLDSVVTIEKDLAYIYVTDQNRKLIAHTFPQAIPAAILESNNQGKSSATDHDTIHLPEGDIQEITVPLRGGKLGEIHVGLTEAYFQEPLTQARNDVILVTLLVSIPGLIILLVLTRLITKPLSKLARAADQISQGQFDTKLATSDDEIGQLSRAFNRMTEELRIHLAEQESAEKTLEKSENLYRTLVDNIDLGITLISKDFEVLLANNGQGKLMNTSSENFIGRKCYEVFEKRGDICNQCPGYKAMQSGKAEEAERTTILDDGSQRQVYIRAFPVRDEKREIVGFIEIVSDISAQKHMEDEMQRIKNLETIGQLAGGLAHDFNNLLTALIGNIELAKVATPPDSSALPRLEAAESACEQARRLTNNLLTFAKGGMPVKRVTRLPGLLDEACHFALSGTNLRYVLSAPDDIWPVEIDANQMTQVIHNLLVNAKESMGENITGKIFLIAENLVLEENDSLPLAPGRYVKITVADEGRGISKKALETIFHPYFTTKNMGTSRGTGLGLTICHSIIHKHGGHITVSSEEKRGSTFSIYLPAAQSEWLPHAEQQVSTDQTSQPIGLRILLLEDEDEVAQIASRYLVSLHHDCEVARNGKEALKMAREAIDSGKAYDLLILDLTIRGGLGGEEILGQIRQFQSDVPAIVSSGYTADPIMVDYHNHGFQAALPKPFNLSSLRAAINSAVSPA